MTVRKINQSFKRSKANRESGQARLSNVCSPNSSWVFCLPTSKTFIALDSILMNGEHI